MDEITRQAIERAITNSQSEKTSIDKISVRQEVDRLRELMRKAVLTREDILEIHALLISNEAKFVNLSDHERWIINKFYVWINDLVSCAEEWEDYRIEKNSLMQERLKVLRQHSCKDHECLSCTERARLERIMYLRQNITNQLQDVIKFLCRVYVNITRTSLSSKAYMVGKVMDNRWEIQYGIPQAPAEEPKKFRLLGGK
jgi:hypothetical protein